MLGRFWRFMLEASLEIMFVSMISLVKSSDKSSEEDNADDQEDSTESTPGDRFMIVYTIFLLVATFVFICFLIWYTMVGFKSFLEVKQVEQKAKEDQTLAALYRDVFGMDPAASQCINGLG